MKIPCFVYILIFSLASLTSLSFLDAATDSISQHDPEFSDGIKTVSGEELKKMIDDKKSILILDARKNNNGGLIPGAKSLPYNASEKEIKITLNAVPKDMVIVVYCSNIYCPVSGYLAKRLSLMGYTNVYKYPDGLAGWLRKGYPIDAEPTTNGK
ncbi:MAG: rhodanese-like domain-containing protein [Parachlamydiaceae bacterium]